MSVKNNQEDSFSQISSDTNINSKNIETKKNDKKYPISSPIKSRKKKVKFKSRFITVINIESYKKYNSDNEPKNKQNFRIPKYKEIHCTCFIF